MSDELKDFRSALSAAIIAETTLTPELIAGAVVLADSNASPQDIGTLVSTASAKAKGLALVIYSGAGVNAADPEDDDYVMLEATVPMELYVHRGKWNIDYESGKRDGESILLGLIRAVHGTEVGNPDLPCYERLVFRDYRPVADDEFHVWEVNFARRILLKRG